MAEDYRNITTRFFVAGLDLFNPYDELGDFKWRILQNVDPLVDGTLEGRGLMDKYGVDAGKSGGFDATAVASGTLTNAQFPEYQRTTGNSFAVPTNLLVTAPFYGWNVGQVEDNNSYVDAIVTLFGSAWDVGWSAEYPSFFAYLNGVIILNESEKYSGRYRAGAAWAKHPSVVACTAPSGTPIIIIGGDCYIDLNSIDLNALSSTADLTHIGDGIFGPTKWPIINDAGAQTTGHVDFVPAWNLGITEPAAAPASVTATTGGSMDSGVTGASGYQWRYTYSRKSVGAESPPSDATAATDVTGSNNACNLTLTYSIDPQVTFLRIYRLGGTLDSWRFVAEIANVHTGASGATVVYKDIAADSTIALAAPLDTESVLPFYIQDSATAFKDNTIASRYFGPFQGRFNFGISQPLAAIGTYGDEGPEVFLSQKNTTFYAATSYVWWSNINDPFLCDPEVGFTQVGGYDERLEDGFLYSSFPFCYSREAFYALDYGGPDAAPIFTARKLPLGMGAYQHAVGKNFLYFANDRGIWRSDLNSSLDEISKPLAPLFSGRDVEDYKAIETVLNMQYCEPYLYVFYKNAGTSYNIVFDTVRERWWQHKLLEGASPGAGGGLSDATLQALGAWRDPEARTTYFGPTGSQDLEGREDDALLVWQFGNDRTETDEPTYALKARTAAWDAGIPHTDKLFGNVIIDYDRKGATLTVTPYYEDVAGTPFNISAGSGRQIIPQTLADVYARNMALQFDWTLATGEESPIIYKATVLYRADEEELYHWESPEDSFGHEGWFHVRDGFFDLYTAGTNDIVVTLTVDGQGHSYTISPAAGVRRKHYLEFDGVRGKVIKVVLASEGLFRFYSDTTILYAKPWQSALGYKPLPLAGQAGYADFLRKGGGT